jgi:hypothetical protein
MKRFAKWMDGLTTEQQLMLETINAAICAICVVVNITIAIAR